jgi:hypothetical protein
MNTDRRRSWWQRLLLFVLWTVVVVVALAAGWCWHALRDRNPGYSVSLDIDAAQSAAAPRPFQVGFGRVPINPNLSDPKRPVWVAGFDQHRAATALHDSLWAHACVLDDGYTRIGIVSLDAIGFFHDEVIEVRRRLEGAWRLDYAMVCSTHNHSTPDLMGLWGPHPLKSGVDAQYREQVITAASHALGQAAESLKPARMAVHEIKVPAEGLVRDTRKPIVFDSDLRVMHFTAPEGGATLGTVVGWGNHPETVWGDNTEITSDFCGYLREALEKGITLDGQCRAEGLGGVHVYVNGAVGGLMTTHPSITVRDPYLDREFERPSHDKARAVGHQLASRLLPVLRTPDAVATNHVPISVHARTVELPVDNAVFFLAPVLGLIDRGHVRWKTLRTEVALVTVGDASIACLPGEVYPEIVNGGIERAPGGDFGCDPVEVPPIRTLMPGKVKFVFGLANDEIGYIIPKSEWDRQPPYLYESSKGVYGEINSVGPETAPRLHQAFRALCPASK